MISDAFGWSFVNNRILADKYAKNGHFRVFLPDFMDGEKFCVSMLTHCKSYPRDLLDLFQRSDLEHGLLLGDCSL